MRSRKLLALIFTLLAIAPALAGYMTLLGAGVGSIQPIVSWVSTTDPTFPSSSLTFSRTSLATMFDSTGKLTYAPNNLLTQSNNFASVSWTKVTATITSGVSDPLGGTNAFTVTANAANAQVYQGVPFTGAGSVNFIQAIWVKRRTGSGTVSIYTPNGLTKTPIAVNGSWQLFYTAGAGNAANIAYNTVFFNVSGDAVDIYAATLSAVTYETSPRTADQVITTSAAYYGPRIDYDPNTLAVKGLLIEEARTNLLLQSGNFSASWSTIDFIRTTDGTLGPDGATAMAKYTANAATSSHELFTTAPVSFTAGSNHTASLFVKKGNYRYVFINMETSSTSGFLAVFDLDNPTAATQTWALGTGSYVGSKIENEGGGIYRIQITGAISSGTTAYVVAGFVAAATGNPTTSLEPSWTAAGTEYGYFFGGQLELGSFATSYIPTAAASVTRAADVVQFTGAALTALQGSAGSAITETISLSDTSPASITNLIRGTNSILYRDTTGKTGTTNGTTALLTAAAPTWNVSLRNGLAWSAAGRSLVYTSGAVATDANAVSNGGTLYLGSNNGSAVENGWYKSFAIYNQRLSDATLQAKSVVGASYAANDNGVRFAFANDNLPVHWRIAL